MDFLLSQSHGHSFQEVVGLEAYYPTELVCDCALDKLFPSRDWISYSASELGDQIVELNRCICMSKRKCYTKRFYSITNGSLVARERLRELQGL